MAAQFDRAGRPKRTNYVRGRPAANKGKRYDLHPPPPGAIVRAVGMLGESPRDLRLAALIAVLWRAGLSLGEALALAQGDCDPHGGFVFVVGKREAATRKARMDAWGFERVERWREVRRELPAGPLFCVTRRPTAGQAWDPAGARLALHGLGAKAGVKQLTPRQLRHAHAAELLKQGVPLAETYRQLGLSAASNNRVPSLVLGTRPRKRMMADVDRIVRDSRGRKIGFVSEPQDEPEKPWGWHVAAHFYFEGDPPEHDVMVQAVQDAAERMGCNDFVGVDLKSVAERPTESGAS